jgi:hypothetical protein
MNILNNNTKDIATSVGSTATVNAVEAVALSGLNNSVNILVEHDTHTRTILTNVINEITSLKIELMALTQKFNIFAQCTTNVINIFRSRLAALDNMPTAVVETVEAASEVI